MTAPPRNTVWDPALHANRLLDFMYTPVTTVGVGWALPAGSQLDEVMLAEGVPVGLSTFTTHEVSVDYVATSDRGPLGAGTLVFIPGETVKRIQLETDGMDDIGVVQLALSDPVNAEVTGEPR